MQKKIITIFCLIMIFLLSACGSRNASEDSSQNDNGRLVQEESADTPDTESVTEENTDTQSSNILIAYFSRVGNTDFDSNIDATTSASININGSNFIGNCEVVAEFIQEQTGGDIFFIQTEEKYPSDYRATTDQASIEQTNNARPTLISSIENMDNYDTVVLIYPNWWGTLPQPLFTFLETYDFSGKTILPICTHEGSGLGSSARDIALICPDAELLDGLAIRGSNAASSQSAIEEWLRNSGL